MSSVYRQQLEAYLKRLTIKAGRVLDVAGGSNPVRNRVHAWDVETYHILDNHLEESKAAVIYEHDMNLPLSEELELVEPYDVLFCLEMMDYIWNPVQACINLRYFTLPGGRLIMTFPFVYPNHNPAKQDYLRFTKFGAMKLLAHAGFRVEDVIPRKMQSTAAWDALLEGDGYRSRGASEQGTLYDAGYIIVARAI